MAQKLAWSKEQVENLDKVEPYGATAEARAASQTSNFFSNLSAQFGRVFGWQSERMAKKQAMEYAFEYDEEHGMPVLPETFAIGGRAALEAYQTGVETRYEDNLMSSLTDNMKRIAMKYPEDEAGFRQEAAIQIGAMAGKVAGGYEGVFLDQATKLEAGMATDIAIFKAKQDRIRARQAAYNKGNRHNDGLGPVTPDQLAASEQTLIQSMGEDVWETIPQSQRDIMILNQRTELMRGIGTGELTRPAADAAEGANNGDVLQAHTLFSNKTVKDRRITQLGTDILTFPDSLGGEVFSNMSAADKRDWEAAQFPGLKGRHDLWASSAATYNHPDITASQASVFQTVNGQGHLLQGQEAAFSFALSGNAPWNTVAQAGENWSNLRGYQTGTSSWAAQHPKQAAALDVIDYTLRVEGFTPPQGMEVQDYYNTIIEKAHTAADISDDVINEGLKLEKGSTRVQREDTIRSIIRDSHPYIMPGPELEAMVDQGLAISRVNAAVNGEALSAKDIIDGVIQTSYDEAPGFTRGGGTTGGYIPKNIMPIVDSLGDNVSQDMIRMAVWHAAKNSGINVREPGASPSYTSRREHGTQAPEVQPWSVMVYDNNTVGISIGGNDMGLRVEVDAINDRIRHANGTNDPNILRQINLLEIEARQYLTLNGEMNIGTDPYVIDIQQRVDLLRSQLVNVDVNFAFEGFTGGRTE